MNQIESWLDSIGWSDTKIAPASSDASFRSYFRVVHNEQTYIVMDASRQIDSLKPFLDIQKRLYTKGVVVPKIFKENLELGFLILEDFGHTHLLDIINEKHQNELYKKAIDEMVLMQSVDASSLLLYDRDFLLEEMRLCNKWYLQEHLKTDLDNHSLTKLDNVFEFIANEVLSQPQNVFVHRDFHSRNIMVAKGDKLGVIDFQDARSGAITYDLVSLLKDCYYEIEDQTRRELIGYFKEQKKLDVTDETIFRWVDMMGLQRHIKVLGIFARLFYRDAKDGYLKDMPLTLKYVLDTAVKYPETAYLCSILKESR